MHQACGTGEAAGGSIGFAFEIGGSIPFYGMNNRGLVLEQNRAKNGPRLCIQNPLTHIKYIAILVLTTRQYNELRQNKLIGRFMHEI